jgi:hypothetical protein
MELLLNRAGNNPRRRIASSDRLSVEQRAELAALATYGPSGHHKRFPADYGLERTSPRPNKSLCDLLRTIPLAEAEQMLKEGILNGMISDFFFGLYPKYVWCLDAFGEVYEAKTDDKVAVGTYHGYCLEGDDAMREIVRIAWKQRWQQVCR